MPLPRCYLLRAPSFDAAEHERDANALLLIGFVGPVGVADLGHEVVLLVEDKVADTSQVRPLRVGVDVHLDDTIDDGLADLVLGRAGTTVEDQEPDMCQLYSPLPRFRKNSVVEVDEGSKVKICKTDLTPPSPP